MKNSTGFDPANIFIVIINPLSVYLIWLSCHLKHIPLCIFGSRSFYISYHSYHIIPYHIKSYLYITLASHNCRVVAHWPITYGLMALKKGVTYWLNKIVYLDKPLYLICYTCFSQLIHVVLSALDFSSTCSNAKLLKMMMYHQPPTECSLLPACISVQRIWRMCGTHYLLDGIWTREDY